jgi:hypothetical protein
MMVLNMVAPFFRRYVNARICRRARAHIGALPDLVAAFPKAPRPAASLRMEQDVVRAYGANNPFHALRAREIEGTAVVQIADASSAKTLT